MLLLTKEVFVDFAFASRDQLTVRVVLEALLVKKNRKVLVPTRISPVFCNKINEIMENSSTIIFKDSRTTKSD